jgi:hypothetical protein
MAVDQAPRLGDIPIHVPDTRAYLEALWRASAGPELHLEAACREIETWLGGPPDTAAPAPAINIGATGEHVYRLLDREWYRSPHNEFDECVRYFESSSLFAGCGSVAVLGAGTCRLADYLSSLAHVHSVEASDLSWQALHYGQALIAGRIDRLPEKLVRPRPAYAVDRQARRMVAETRHAGFGASRGQPQNVSYRVRDAFLGEPIDHDTVCLPFLLDLFQGAHGRTLLAWTCEHARRLGQSIVVVTALISEIEAGPGARDPMAIVETLTAMGFEIDHLDIVDLPWSMSYYDSTYRRTTWPCIVTRARRVRGGAPVRLSAVRSDRPAGPPASGARPDPDRDMILSLCPSGEAYEVLRSRCRQEGIDDTRWARAIAGLMSSGRLQLSPS